MFDSPIAKSQLHHQDYLELEVNAEDRHEYIDGEVILRPGGTPNHNQMLATSMLL